jgi:hypothetical protein
MVAHPYIPTYLRGLQFQATPGKKLVRPHLKEQVGSDGTSL